MSARDTILYLLSKQKKNWLLNGRIGTGGMTSARLNYERGMFVAGVHGQFAEDENRTGWEADGGVKFSDCTFEAKIAGPSLGLAYTQAIMQHFTVGTEISFSPLQDAARLKFVGVAGNKETTGAWTSIISTAPVSDSLSLNSTRRIV